jgi:hypothetical protein
MSDHDVAVQARSGFKRFRTAHSNINKASTEAYPALLELESRFEKQQGKRDLGEGFGQMGWHQFIEACGCTPANYRMWKSRLFRALEEELADEAALADKQDEEQEESNDDTEVPGDLTPEGEAQKNAVSPIPAVRPSSKSARPTGERQKREEATQALLDKKDAEYPASDAAPITPLAGAVYTREQANSEATMRMTTELVGKYVWLARSAEAFVLVLAFDKATAEEIANLNGVVPVSCINVNVAETAVIMQGVIDESRGFRFSMKEPSEVEKAIEAEMSKTAAQLSEQTDAKKPVQSETTADELVEVG